MVNKPAPPAPALATVPLVTPVLPSPEPRDPLGARHHSQEEDDAGVGHGVRQPQDAAAHDGVAQVEDGHPKRRLAFKLRTRDTRGDGHTGGMLPGGVWGGPVPPLTSVKCVCFFSAPWGRNSSISALRWFSSNLGAGGRSGGSGRPSRDGDATAPPAAPGHGGQGWGRGSSPPPLSPLCTPSALSPTRDPSPQRALSPTSPLTAPSVLSPPKSHKQPQVPQKPQVPRAPSPLELPARPVRQAPNLPEPPGPPEPPAPSRARPRAPRSGWGCPAPAEEAACPQSPTCHPPARGGRWC